MSDVKFTPGPWMVNNSPGAGWEIKAAIPELKKYRPNDGGSVIWTVPEGTSITPAGEPKPLIGYEPWVQFPPKWWIEMAKNNANLIAAAPEMYGALKRALLFITNGRENGYIRMPDIDSGDPALETPNIIRMALAKADGKA